MSKATSPDDSIDELLSAAQSALHQGDIAGALSLYQSALLIDPEHGMANYWIGVLALKNASFREAVACLTIAARKHPDFPDFQLDLGTAYLGLNDLARASECFEAARRTGPGYGQTQLNFAASFEKEQRFDEAIEACKRGLVLFPDDSRLLVKLADLHSRKREWPEALSVWKRILALRPECSSSYDLFGETCYRAGEFELARDAFARAVELDPGRLHARLNLGLALQKLGEIETAIDCFKRAAALEPRNSDVHKGLGDLYRELERWPEAIGAWQLAVDLRPEYADAWQNLGLGLECQNRFDEALACHERVVQLCPEDPTAIRYLGMICQDLGRLNDARECYRKALRLAPNDPEVHWQMFSLQASTGELPEAWDEHEWRWHIQRRTTPKRDFEQPVWEGESLQGKTLLLHAEQGFGDTIQVVRYVPLILQRGGKVLLWSPPELVPVLRTVSGAQTVFSQMKPEYRFDAHVPLMSLPRVFRTTLDTIPNQVPYLRAPSDAKIRFPKTKGRNPKVGLVWCGSLSQPNDRRPISFEKLAPLLRMAGINFFSLQKGAAGIPNQPSAWSDRVFDLSDQLTDFGQTAEAVENLDLLITVDTAIAHLAGALGKAVWVLLSFTPDWRWMLDREDSPWYPTMRLFRQSKPGDWSDVLDRLCAELSKWNSKWHWSSTLNSWLGQGLVHHQAGRLEEAERFYRLVLEKDTKHCDATRFMGVLFRQRGDLGEARTWMEKALAYQPSSAQAHHDLGLIQYELGRIGDAIQSYRHAIGIQPEFAEAHYNLGNAYYASKMADDARAAYRRAVEHEPSMADAYYNLGLLSQEEGRIDAAIEHYERVVRLDPAHAHALLNLGVAFKEAARLNDAERCFRRLLNKEPANHQAKVNLASTLTSKGELEAAEALCREVLDAEPNLGEAWLNSGVVRQALGRISPAIEAFHRALELKPDFADARYNLGIAQLLSGDFESGWRNYEARWQSDLAVFAPRQFSAPRWDVQNLRDRTLLIHAEQGLGDSIQFVRYATVAAEHGARVILECPDPLARLLGTAEGVDRVIPLGQPLPRCDFHVPLMSLPFRFGTTLDSVPNRVPYLRVPDGVRIQIPARSGTRMRVGLAWAGNPHHGADRARSIPLADLFPVWSRREFVFYSLQVGSANRVLSEKSSDIPIIDLEPGLVDFAATAAAIRELDLVICADTAVAHLSGALGKPVWVLLPFAPDWRWLTNRSSSPWYPSARLFRQQRIGDWPTVIGAVAGALSKLENTR